MEEKNITHEAGGKTYTVTVREVTALQGMKHTIMISEAVTSLRESRPAEEKDKPIDLDALGDEEVALFMLRRFAWPDCMTCVVKSEGFDHQTLTFEQFTQLPEAFVARWQKAARELNPHWQAEQEELNQAEKKDEGASGEK